MVRDGGRSPRGEVGSAACPEGPPLPPGSGIGRVLVVGGGIMGNGIAQVVATAGLQVTVVDISEEALERTTARVGKSLGRFVKSGRLTREEADAALARIALSTDL